LTGLTRLTGFQETEKDSLNGKEAGIAQSQILFDAAIKLWGAGAE